MLVSTTGAYYWQCVHICVNGMLSADAKCLMCRSMCHLYNDCTWAFSSYKQHWDWKSETVISLLGAPIMLLVHMFYCALFADLCVCWWLQVAEKIVANWTGDVRLGPSPDATQSLLKVTYSSLCAKSFPFSCKRPLTHNQVWSLSSGTTLQSP